MEGNNSAMEINADSSRASGSSAAVSNTKMTSETLRLELRDGDKQNHMHEGSVSQDAALSNPVTQKKKGGSTFQITSVVYNVDGPDGEESPDETEESDILDSSKMTDIDQETPTSYSEEYSKSEDVGAPATVIPTSSQYGITAVVQQNDSGGLLTSRLPQGITVNVTKGGIALAEADGVVTSDTENLSNRFKIVKIASNKPFKKGRWVCFDFMDSPATSAVGVRNTESTQGVSIPLALVNQGQLTHASQSQHATNQLTTQLQQGLQLQTPQSQQQFPTSSQAGNTQQASIPFTSQVPPQIYHSNVSNQPGNMSSQQMSMQLQQHLQQQQQKQQQLQQQIQQKTSSVLPSQALENRQVVVVSGPGQQPAINTNISQSSPIAQGISAVNILQQQIQNQPQEQQLLQQQTPQQQPMQTQMHPPNVMAGHMASGQQITQQQMQHPSSHTQQQQFQSQINQQQQQQQQQQQLPQQTQQQQQLQHQIQQQMQQQQQVHQPTIPSQTLVGSQVPPGQENAHLHKDPSPSNQPSNSSYQPSQQQQLQASQQQQSMSLSHQPSAQQIQQQQQSSSQVQLPQQPLTASPSAGQVSHGGSSIQSSSMANNLSNYPSVSGLTSVANLSNVNISKMITSHISASEGTTPMETNETTGEPAASGGEDAGAGDEDKQSASTASTVAIDNKIEQAMDLVKSHLMFAVREEVDVLKERIGELMERINHLEYENTVLRKYAPQEALQQIQQPHGGAPNP